MTEHGRQQDDEDQYAWYAQVQSTDRPPMPVSHRAGGEGTKLGSLVFAAVLIAALAIGIMAVI